MSITTRILVVVGVLAVALVRPATLAAAKVKLVAWTKAIITVGPPTISVDASGKVLSMSPSVSYTTNMGCVSRLDFMDGNGVLIGRVWGTNTPPVENVRSVLGPRNGKLGSVNLSWDAYLPNPQGTNAAFTVYKSVWLGTVATPWKPTAFTTANRTSINVAVVAGQTYFFKMTATETPFGESLPSNSVTNRVE